MSRLVSQEVSILRTAKIYFKDHPKFHHSICSGAQGVPLSVDFSKLYVAQVQFLSIEVNLVP